MTDIRLSPKDKRGFLKSLGKPAGEKLLELIPKLNVVGSVTWVIEAEATNVCEVALQVKNENGDNVAARLGLQMYLSSDATGSVPAVLTSAVGSSTGGILNPTTGGGFILTSTTGRCLLALTDTTTNLTRYVNIILPSGKIVTSPPVVWGTGS